MSAKSTPGPWGWQKLGEWVLVGQYGPRPIVLSTRTRGPMKERGFTSLDHERCLLVPFDPAHPDARLIAAAPDLADALAAIFGLLESNVLVRNTDDDAAPGYALKAMNLVMALKRADDALRAAGREP